MTSVAGAVTAVLGVMLLSAMGLGALLAASETAFTGGQGARRGLPHLAGHQDLSQQRRTCTWATGAAPGRSFYLQGLLVGASNPKAVLFFAAFFPQFINPAAPLAPQLAMLALTFVAFEFAVLTLCAGRIAPGAAAVKSSGL
jgi:threonine/homoserine/homoserine lactone efflux protein